MINFKYIFFAFLLFISCNFKIRVKGIVLDSVDGSYIPFAKIKTKSFIAESDFYGKFEINCNKGEMVSFHALGYYSDTVKIKNKDLTIKLLLYEHINDTIIIKYRG
jgi:hypothetical protein